MFQVCHTMQVHKNLKWFVATRRISLNHRTVKIGAVACTGMGTYLYTFTVVYEEKNNRFLVVKQYILICTSLVPRPKEEEEEKGFGFSRLSMHLIGVEFHGDRILLTYFCTLVMLKLILRITLSVELLAAYSV